MVQIYAHDCSSEDQRKPHVLAVDGQPQYLTVEELYELTGTRYLKIDTSDPNYMQQLDQFCQDNNYKNRDEITVSKKSLGKPYEEKMDIFFQEHIHEDDEIRFVLDGLGYFDVRDKNDRWLRILVEKNDLLVLPAGIYHRFTVEDSLESIQVIRVFKEDPKWTPLNRPHADENEFRLAYLNSL